MRDQDKTITVVEDDSDELRWSLVERIVTSRSFAKSERLMSFLTCICDLAQRGEFDLINEQYIGTKVFGRDPDYDPSVDSIVRSHASRLRHRLRQYFSEEGASEEVLLTIPTGAYVPVFAPRMTSIALDLNPTGLRSTEPAISAASSQDSKRQGDDVPKVSRAARLLTVLSERWIWVVAGMCFIGATSFIGWRINSHRQERLAVEAFNESTQPFWLSLLNDRQKTIVVEADSGLVIFQGFTKRRVSLARYINGSYLKDIQLPPEQAKVALDLGTRRYTAIVDVGIVNRILRMPKLDKGNVAFRYARDLRMNEIKQGNLILLGTYESTPWVQLFEPSMNFYFENDLPSGVFSAVNRHPLPGELPRYDATNSDPEHTIYGVVAYRPTLNGSGKVLILEGQSMAGTETASDFVFDDAYLLPFLNSIRRADGSIPYFEVLLRSRSLGSEASRLEVVAFRVENQ